MPEQRKILITAALPYANGAIHLGHMVEHTLVDMWARFYKMSGHDCLLLCADDTHGTPIMLSAKKQNISPEELIAQSQKDHIKDFADFEIEYDNYSSTHAESNRAIASEIFRQIQQAGHLEFRTIKQAYCEYDKMFLPDRFVKGICPNCGAEDQYGDGCEQCSKVYTPIELKSPQCVICGNTPVELKSEHIFLKLNDFKPYLQEWIKDHTEPAIQNKLHEWLKDDLKEWCISRDEPYFGFEIPDHPGKYFYVWFDAPIGYMASLKEWCDARKLDFHEYWNDPQREIYHVIGKDIVYHHTLFWPAMLKASKFQTPQRIMVHGMLNVNGAKMSKSRGTFINVRTYLKYLEPTYFRYYLACKINGSIDDIDLSFDDFVARVNADLIGKITNVASRGAQMLHKLDGQLGSVPADGQPLIEQAQKLSAEISQHFDQTDFAKGMLLIRSIADEANRYFDQYEPWKLIKNDPETTRGVLTTILNLFRIMAVYLKPVLPSYVAKVEQLFGEKPYGWDTAQTVLENQPVAPYKHLLKRIDAKALKQIQEASAAPSATKDKAAKTSKAKAKDKSPETISIDDFLKVDLRVAKIVEADHVEGADKLIKLTLDIGQEQTKQVFAGIKSAYAPEDLKGRLTIMVANLQPRKMKFGVSEGMVLAAGEGQDIHLLAPDSGAKPGQPVK
jgi:methionyl-tRNA synthetase